MLLVSLVPFFLSSMRISSPSPQSNSHFMHVKKAHFNYYVKFSRAAILSTTLQRKHLSVFTQVFFYYQLNALKIVLKYKINWWALLAFHGICSLCPAYDWSYLGRDGVYTFVKFVWHTFTLRAVRKHRKLPSSKYRESSNYFRKGLALKKTAVYCGMRAGDIVSPSSRLNCTLYWPAADDLRPSSTLNGRKTFKKYVIFIRPCN